MRGQASMCAYLCLCICVGCSRFWTFRCFKLKSMRINIQYVAFAGIKPPPTAHQSHLPHRAASSSAWHHHQQQQQQHAEEKQPNLNANPWRIHTPNASQLMFALRNGIVRWMLRVLQFRLGTRLLASDSGFGSGSSMVRFCPCWLFVCEFSLPWQMNWRFRAFQLACGAPCCTARHGRAWHDRRHCLQCGTVGGVALRQCFSTFSQCTFSMGLHSIYFLTLIK